MARSGGIVRFIAPLVAGPRLKALADETVEQIKETLRRRNASKPVNVARTTRDPRYSD